MRQFLARLANGVDEFARHPGRTSPPLRPSLSSRHTQVEIHALSWRRGGSQQRPERATMHHAEASVIGGLERQRVDIVPPDRRLAVGHWLVVCTACESLPKVEV